MIMITNSKEVSLFVCRDPPKDLYRQSCHRLCSGREQGVQVCFLNLEHEFYMPNPHTATEVYHTGET